VSTEALFGLACVLCGDQAAPKTEIEIDGEPTGRFRCSPPVQACTDRWYARRAANRPELPNPRHQEGGPR
jgi:hypothetical protein